MDEIMEMQQQEFESVQYIVIRYGEEVFGIDIKYVDNIVRMQRITRVPNVSAHIKGVLNLRGEVIPVISLRIKMGLPADEITKTTRIIIIKLESGDSIGVLVDEVLEVITLDSGQIEKVAYNSKDSVASFLFGVGKDEERDRLISLLDIGATFGDKEVAGA
ncbi:MAG: chemotaxis protein CheW [Lachnospiraceae bacterium]|nr:chemotaxis protein CheW [Lachnospiraceae bacterium]MCR5338428.1 chemotaxis protein CheW [Lachnospiraceae bacterium]